MSHSLAKTASTQAGVADGACSPWIPRTAGGLSMGFHDRTGARRDHQVQDGTHAASRIDFDPLDGLKQSLRGSAMAWSSTNPEI